MGKIKVKKNSTELKSYDLSYLQFLVTIEVFKEIVHSVRHGRGWDLKYVWLRQSKGEY